MKVLGDLLLAERPIQEIVMGNFALVRAMVEIGTRVVASYPGSPTPEIASAILSIPSDKRPFYFEFSVNEKVATEVAFGASINGHLSSVFFKSVGMNVAADTFMQLSLLELKGGMVIVLGDDPGANSSQNEQDNRHYARMAYTPVFEPATPQDAYDMYKEAARLSTEHAMPVILRMTTHVCHAKSLVRFDGLGPEYATADLSPRFEPAGNSYIPLTVTALEMKRKAREKIRKVEEYSEGTGFTRLYGNNGSGRGIITAGLPVLSLQDVLSEGEQKPDILCLGMSYPLPSKKILEFCRGHEEIKIIEELDPLLEGEIKALAFDAKLSCRITGKEAEEEWIGEYTPDKVRRVLGRTWPDLIKQPDRAAVSAEVDQAPPRPAQLCPGCGHRSAFYAIKKALKDTDITVADIGCHTLGHLPPYEMGQVLLCMGHSSATGAGLSIFNRTRNVVAFIGDSTFFHAGMPGIANAVYNGHPLTLIVLENHTTAMTGHQENPGTGENTRGKTAKLSIRGILEGMGVEHITEVDTYRQEELTKLVREAVAFEGFSVVIARHPCMLKFTRERRKSGFPQKTVVEVDQSACRKIHECVSEFACPSFQVQEDGAVTVSRDLCIGDGSCVQTCPASALVIEKLDEKKDGSDG